MNIVNKKEVVDKIEDKKEVVDKIEDKEEVVEVSEVFPLASCNVCEWDIKTGTDTEVSAVNYVTGLKFNGSMKDFNKALRG